MLIDYDFERFQQTSPSQLTMNWILSVHFLNVTVKDDLASLIVESIINPRLQANRNYVVGEQFIAHTFLGHIYQKPYRESVERPTMNDKTVESNIGMDISYSHRNPLQTAIQNELAPPCNDTPLDIRQIYYPGNVDEKRMQTQ
ncbi:14177_t:CDS:2, partial [Rhizophagus irregularis]